MPRRGLLDNDGYPLPDIPTSDEAQAEFRRRERERKRETPINHNSVIAGDAYKSCACGAILCRNISIREGRCQACRNLDGRARGI